MTTAIKQLLPLIQVLTSGRIISYNTFIQTQGCRIAVQIQDAEEKADVL